MRHLANIIQIIANRQHPCASRLLTSPAGAVTLLISTFSFGFISMMVNSNPTYATVSTLSLSIDNSTVSMNVSPTNINGSFNKSSTSTISASTTNATGYTLGIRASGTGDDATKLINGSDSTAKLSSISEPLTEAQFKALNGTAYNGMWGYLPSKYHSEDNTDFLPSPTTTADILDKTTLANTIANEYTIAIGARVDSSVKTGSYSNTFVILATANAIPYTVTFYDSTVGNMPVDINTTSMTESVTLPSNEPTRNGYTFIGWCSTTPTINANGTDTCSGTSYSAGGTITINQQSVSNDFNLYAMWSGNYTIGALTYMQDFHTLSVDAKDKVIASMIMNEQYQLTDNRDGTKYWIAKLADGHVWMTRNLDLNLSTSTTLNSNNTDLLACNTGIYTTGYSKNDGVCYWKPSTSTENSMNATTSTTTPQSYNPGNVYYYQDQSASSTCTVENECLHWHIGNYYNWSAAIASNNSSGQTDNYAYAGNSICPAGWRMPISIASATAYSEFNYLLVKQGIAVNYVGVNADATWGTNGYSNIQVAPLYIVRSGYNNGSSVLSAASTGTLWSGSSVSGAKVYSLVYSSGSVDPAHGTGDRYTRMPMRCLVRE